MCIELRNGNAIPSGQARKMGSHLAREGFLVGSIANHKDFSLEKMIIAYRTEAARVAQVLCQKFFLEAIFQEEDTLLLGWMSGYPWVGT